MKFLELSSLSRCGLTYFPGISGNPPPRPSSGPTALAAAERLVLKQESNFVQAVGEQNSPLLDTTRSEVATLRSVFATLATRLCCLNEPRPCTTSLRAHAHAKQTVFRNEGADGRLKDRTSLASVSFQENLFHRFTMNI